MLTFLRIMWSIWLLINGFIIVFSKDYNEAKGAIVGAIAAASALALSFQTGG